MGKKLKYKFFFRKSSFKNDTSNAKVLLDLIIKYKPKNFLEIGVLEGVTSKNVCDLLYKFYGNEFKFIGIDLFGTDLAINNKKEFTPISKRYSNPFKYLYFKFIFQYDPNSLEGVKKFLDRYSKSIRLYKGYSHEILEKLDISFVDFVFLDAGHSYNSVSRDLNLLTRRLKKNSIIVCDDYNISHYGVKKAVDELNNKHNIIKMGRFAIIII